MFTLQYDRPGHYDGMMKAVFDKAFIERDKWGFFKFFESAESAIEHFNIVLLRHEKFLDQAALAAFNRNKKQSVDQWRVGLLAIHPPPHSPKVMKLVDVY